MRTRPARVVKNAFNLETMLAGFRYVWQAKLLLGSHLAGSICGAAGWRGGAAADLRNGYSARGAAGRWGCCGRCLSLGALIVSLVMTVRPIKRGMRAS